MTDTVMFAIWGGVGEVFPYLFSQWEEVIATVKLPLCYKL